MSNPLDFFAHAPPSTEEPYRDPVETEAECRFLAAARAVAARALALDAEGWLECAEFRELCALLGVDTDPEALCQPLPEVPKGWRYLRPEETIAPGDQWKPLRRRPSKEHDLRLPFESVQPALYGQTPEQVRSGGLRAQFIRPAGKEGEKEGKREGERP